MDQESQNQTKSTYLIQGKNHFLEQKHQLTISKIEGVYTGLNSQSLIHSFHTAVNGSFVAQISYKKIQHYSVTGEILGVLDVKRSIFLVFMASPSIVMILTGSPLEQDKNHEIIQWNLGTYDNVSMFFTRSFKYTWFSAIFSQSKLFCIGEMNMNKDYQMKGKYIPQEYGLVYFKYPLKQPKTSFIHQKVYHSVKIKPNNEEMSRQLQIVKMNNRSMVGWYAKQLTQNQNGVNFYVYDLEKCDQTWRTIHLKYYNLEIDWKLCSVRISDLYQFKPNFMYVKLGVEPDAQKLGERLLEDEEILYQYQKQYDFVLDSKTGEIRSTKFSQEEPHFVQFIGQYRYITTKKQIKHYIEKARNLRQKNMRSKQARDYKYCMQDKYYHKWLRSQVHQRQFSILYIDPNSEQTIVKEARQFDIVDKYNSDPKRPKIFPITYNPKMLLEYWEERGKVFKMHIKVRKVRELFYPSQLIAVYMLCEILNEPDDDLLSNVGNLVAMQTQNQNEWNWSQQ